MSKSAKPSKSSDGDKVTRWLVIGMISLVVITGALFTVFNQNNENNEGLAALNDFKVGAPLLATIDIAAGSPITFNAGNATVIDLWEDPQCPSCEMFEAALGGYVNDLVRTNKASVRFHVLAFLGDESVRAANASFCAVDEKRYLDFHKALYLVQSPVQNSGFWSDERLIEIGAKAGIKSDTFSNCVKKGLKADLVQANYASMGKYGVKGTPTVFINGKLWERVSNDFNLAEFSAAVEQG